MEASYVLPVRFLVHKGTKSILCMEAGSEFVDMLLRFLQLPVADALSMFMSIQQQTAAGSSMAQAGTVVDAGTAVHGDHLGTCIRNMYLSLDKLRDTRVVVPQAKRREMQQFLLFKAAPPAAASCCSKITLYGCTLSECQCPRTVASLVAGCRYRCPSWCGGLMSQALTCYVQEDNDSISDVYECSTCFSLQALSRYPQDGFSECMHGCGYVVMSRPLHILNKSITTTIASAGKENAASAGNKSAEATDTISCSFKGGAARYALHALSFIVTDDLCILPGSSTLGQTIVLLGSRLAIKNLSDVGSLEGFVTNDEAVELLKVSFTSHGQLALNRVFGPKVSQLFKAPRNSSPR